MTEDSTFCELSAVAFAATQFSVLVSSGQNLRHLWSFNITRAGFQGMLKF